MKKKAVPTQNRKLPSAALLFFVVPLECSPIRCGENDSALALSPVALLTWARQILMNLIIEDLAVGGARDSLIDESKATARPRLINVPTGTRGLL